MRVLLVVSVATLCLGNNLNINNVIDKLLIDLETLVKDINKFPIDNLEKFASEENNFIDIYCQDGWIQYEPSLGRSLDAEGNEMKIKMHLKLGRINTRYDECQVKDRRIFRVSHLEASTIGYTKLEVTVLKPVGGGQCVAKLNSFKTDHGDISMFIGTNMPDKFRYFVYSHIPKQFEYGTISDSLKVKFEPIFRKLIEEGYLCDKLL